METRELTCIRCPIGCHITVELENGEVKSITGNSCPRGEEYAASEVTDPVRIVTSLVNVTGGERPVVSVKTAGNVPKEKMMDVVKALKEIELTAPVKIGDIAAENVAGTGVDVIVTSNDD
jgi:CxxC motif-containing protein